MKKFYPYNFLIPFLLLIQLNSLSQGTMPFGNSYVNISKKGIGGIIEKNDTLEIRNTYYFPTAYNRIYKVRFLGNLPSNTQILSNDSLRIITNEGVTINRYTYASADDAATYLGTPPAGEYNIKINIGTSVSAPLNNSLADITGASTVTPGTTRQILSGTLITTAFRVKVTGNPGDTIVLGAGKFVYRRNNVLNPDTTVNSTQYKILIDSIQTLLCPNVRGVNIAAEMGGTFDSGIVQNRSDLAYPIPGYNYVPLTPFNVTNDGRYCIVNNLSPYASTYQNAELKPNCVTAYPGITSCANRMFSSWYIIGDHTGTNNSIGNPPAPAGTMGGYMLAVNASYAMSDAYRQTINTLCPNTTYEFSAWIRNVCQRGSRDMDGIATYAQGVLPNLTFVVDGIDRYSSGEMDTLGWQKKGFIFRTGLLQTSITLAIRNNAPGGGGNDWVMDDIAIVTCSPELIMNPKDTVTSCKGLNMFLSDTVRSIENTYINYCWQKSIDALTWINTGVCGTKTPAYINGMWQYVVDTSFINVSADSGTYYRLQVATTLTNLIDANCSINNSQKIFLKVYDVNCKVLEINSLTLTAEEANDKAILRWTNSLEKNVKAYHVEKSSDGKIFSTVAIVNSNSNDGSGSYKFTDPAKLKGLTFYRIKLEYDVNADFKYSRIASINNLNFFNFSPSVSNPFTSQIEIKTTASQKGILEGVLVDMWGRIIKKKTFNVSKGPNTILIDGLQGINSGVYILRLKLGDNYFENKLIKTNL
ncbi:MAG: T9SS type A sorting domain-containing protein [Ginsengibacter sp.]